MFITIILKIPESPGARVGRDGGRGEGAHREKLISGIVVLRVRSFALMARYCSPLEGMATGAGNKAPASRFYCILIVYFYLFSLPPSPLNLGCLLSAGSVPRYVQMLAVRNAARHNYHPHPHPVAPFAFLFSLFRPEREDFILWDLARYRNPFSVMIL